ncbi:MAG TPA: TMEM175 family protein [Povalibacter sp.]|nr:TMEM175 family protein [Povalibacter sp.]
MDANPVPTRTVRDHLPFVPRREQHFRWRGHEVSRLEGFTDAVFAFAVTLLVVSLEVPRTYEGLIDVVRGFPAFVICFTLLMLFWNAHYRFFRRYGLENMTTRLGTMAILVLVLFSVYPLKFLFTIVTAGLFGIELPEAAQLATAEWRMIYVIYGLGFAGVWSLYALLQVHALRQRDVLQMDAMEVVLTRGSLYEYLIHVGVALLSVTLALTTSLITLPGWIYFLLAPLQTMNGMWHGRRARKLSVPAPQPKPGPHSDPADT